MRDGSEEENDRHRCADVPPSRNGSAICTCDHEKEEAGNVASPGGDIARKESDRQSEQCRESDAANEIGRAQGRAIESVLYIFVCRRLEIGHRNPLVIFWAGAFL